MIFPLIIDLAPLLGDYVDTAAAVTRLDLVIMTDSSVAHLCGAMGRPVWVLLGYGAFWLWVLDRPDSPWYPSMRLFRQQAWGRLGRRLRRRFGGAAAPFLCQETRAVVPRFPTLASLLVSPFRPARSGEPESEGR